MKKGLVILAILAGLLLVIFISRGASRAALNVEVEVLATHPISRSIFASGRVHYKEEVSLTSEIVGVVDAVHIREGQRVSKGQLVMELRDDEYVASVEQVRALVRVRQAEIERARLNVQNAEQEAQRSARLREAKLIALDAHERAELALDIAQVDLRSAQASLAQARAQLEQAERLLGKSKLYSPIDGVVTTLDLKVGETAIPSVGGIPGSILMKISDPASLHARVNVDEADIGSVAIGDEVEIVAVAFRKEPIRGVLESMAASARVAEGRQGLSFEVKIRLNDHNAIQLRPGMSCRAEIFTDSRADVLAASMQSVMVEENGDSGGVSYYVYVHEDGVARKVPVETGISDDSRYEMVSGVQAGQELIVGPPAVLLELKSGDAVKAGPKTSSSTGTAATDSSR